MSFGGSEIVDAVLSKLSPWLNNIVDYDDVQRAYKKKGQLESQKAKLEREIDRVEDDVVLEHGQPRSNAARILKINATRQLRDDLAELEAELALIKHECILLEFSKDMLKTACYRTKIQWEL